MAKAIPEGYHSVTPALTIKGADKALEFLKKAFGAEQRGDVMKTPDGKVMHAELKIGDSVIMLSEAIQDTPTQSSLNLYLSDVDAAFKRAVDAGCKSVMPPADMFWGDRWGRVSDPFGNRWGLATHKEDVPPAEMNKRAQEFMKKQQQQQPQH